jgi:membrane-bound lytic murein transglycosylase D
MYRKIQAILLIGALGVGGCSTLPQSSEEMGAYPYGEETAPDLAETAHLWEPEVWTETAQADKQEQGDLWVRISHGYNLLPTLEHPEIERTIDEFAERRRFFDAMGRQARPYLHYIVQEVEKRGLPMELALLPAIESAYSPLAYSPARAAGIWQFMPGTATHFGIKQNRWYDGRRDLRDSTDAALDYLEKLYTFFNGDWLNALAAYNSGEGTVQRAIEKNQAAGRPTDYWSLDLPRETREYVPRLMAVSAIVAQPKKYGIELPSIADKPYLIPVKVGAQIDLSLAAQLAGLSTKELRQLNAGFTRSATDPDGSHELLMPIDKADTFRQRLTQLSKDKLMPTPVSDDPAYQAPVFASRSKTTTITYRIRKGDTLDKIASRHGTTAKELRRLNKLSAKHRLQIGQSLFLPGKAETQTARAESKTTQAASRNAKPEYQVRAGDTLGHIAARFNVTVAALRRENNLSSKTNLKPGQTLRLPTVRQASATPASAKPRKKILYTVKQGDSIWDIARLHRVEVKDLLAWNKLDRRSVLQRGQTLQILPGS